MSRSSFHPESTDLSPTLVRRLGPLDGASLIVSNVIGGGIFLVPTLIAQWVPEFWAMLGAWLVGGFLAFTGAMAYAELAVHRPRAGGEYVYLREAFGPVVGFLTGWTSFVAGFSGAIAAGAVGLASYLGRFFPSASDASVLAHVDLPFITLSVSAQALVALAAIWVLTMVHIVGLGPGRVVQNTLAGIKVAVLVLFVTLGFFFGEGSISNISASTGSVTPSLWLLALIPIMFSFSGWNAATYVAEETYDPVRNIPVAMVIGTVIVIVIYLLLNVLYVYALPLNELSMVDIRVVDASAERLFGPRVAGPLAALSVIMLAASISAMVLTGPRVYYAMARDGLFFSDAARVHQRFRTPITAILAQSSWSSVLVLAGTFDQLLLYTGFAVVLFSGLAVAALFVFRRRLPSTKREFQAWGYPIAPLIFVVASFAMVANAIWREPAASGAGLVVIGAGLPVYGFLRRRRNS